MATQLTEGLEVFDGHKLGLLQETAFKSSVCKESGVWEVSLWERSSDRAVR